MSITTKTGDDGTTSLAGGKRVLKNHPGICLLGSLDELCCFLGEAKCQIGKGPVREILQVIQEHLFVIMEIIALEQPDAGDKLSNSLIYIEGNIKKLETRITLKGFVIPGTGPVSAKLDISRTICRRTERDAVSLGQNGGISPDVLIYLNRLSDLLFILARIME